MYVYIQVTQESVHEETELVKANLQEIHINEVFQHVLEESFSSIIRDVATQVYVCISVHIYVHLCTYEFVMHMY